MREDYTQRTSSHFLLPRTRYRGASCFRLNEIVVLRQELARFVPNAIMLSPQDRMPSGGVPVPQAPQRVPSQAQAPIHPATHHTHGTLPCLQCYSVFDGLSELAPVNMMHYQNLMAKVSLMFESVFVVNIYLSSAATNATWCPTTSAAPPTSGFCSFGCTRQYHGPSTFHLATAPTICSGSAHHWTTWLCAEPHVRVPHQQLLWIEPGG